MPMAEAEIRPATEADRPALERMMAALQDFEADLGAPRPAGAEIAGSHVAALLDWVSEDPAAGCLVATRGDAAVGFVLWGIDTEFGTYMVPALRRHGVISDLWIDETERGTGLARRLVAGAEAHLVRHGIARVLISAIAANAGAVAVYAALGYAPAFVTLEKALPGA